MACISSHHGITRTEYFYRQAVELAETSDSTLDESAFRYPGPRPTSKETGILMLTDTVEAAVPDNEGYDRGEIEKTSRTSHYPEGGQRAIGRHWSNPPRYFPDQRSLA